MSDDTTPTVRAATPLYVTQVEPCAALFSRGGIGGLLAVLAVCAAWRVLVAVL